MALAGVAFAAWGHVSASPAALALGVLLLAGFVLDPLALAFWRAVTETAAPQANPNPAIAGAQITVSCPTAQQPAELLDPWDGTWRTLTETGVTMIAQRRGKYTIGPVRRRVTTPLGLWAVTRCGHLTHQMSVWPATTPLVLPAVQPGRSRRLGLPVAHLDDTSLREYAPGDDLRRVHWRSLARSNRLLTRAEEPSSVPRSVGALMVEAGASVAAVELGVSLLASWAEAMLRDGRELAIDVGSQVLHQPSQTRLMETLAALDTSAELAPGDQPDADDTLLVCVPAGLVSGRRVTRPTADGQTWTPPAPTPDGIAVVLSTAGAPTVLSRVPADWGVLHIDAAASLDDAGRALQAALDARAGADDRRAR